MKYRILDDSFFQNNPNCDVVIEYEFIETGDTYTLEIMSKYLKTEKDVEDWFYVNYSSRPVKMVAYSIKK